MAMKISFIYLGIVLALFFSGCISLQSPQAVQNVTNASTAPAPQATCSGPVSIDVSTGGSTIAAGVTYRDSCIDEANARKYYCTGNSLSSLVMTCAQGSVCQGGACVQQQAAQQPVAKCTETDQGKDFYTPGSATYENVTSSDVCQGSYDLLEYYCQNDALSQTTYHCPSGDKCENGACVHMGRTCTDSDSTDQSQAGTATLYGGGVVVSSQTDQCVDSGSYTEYDCGTGSITNTTVQCQGGETCSGGACVPPCKTLTGAVTAGGRTYDNYCKNSNTLVSYSCNAGSVSSSQEVCPGYCSGNRCLSASETLCRKNSSGAFIVTGSTVLFSQNNTCLDYQSAKYYICDSGQIVTQYKTCGEYQLCQEGSCTDAQPSYCYELNGENIHVKSGVITTQINRDMTEKDNYCLNSKTLVQFYCAAGNMMTNYTTCPGEETCGDAACAYPYTCSETVSRSADSAAQVTLYDGQSVVRSEKDACTTDPYAVQQVSCDSTGRIVYDIVKCPQGKACDTGSGVCK